MVFLEGDVEKFMRYLLIIESQLIDVCSRLYALVKEHVAHIETSEKQVNNQIFFVSNRY